MCRLNLKEFHRSFKPVLYIVKISGLLPNEIRNVNGILIIGKSTFGVIQTVTFIVLYSGMVYFIRKNGIILVQLDGVSMIMENIRLFMYELIFYVMMLSAIIRQKEFLQIIKRISELDSLLFQLRENIDYRKEFRKNVILVGLFCAIFGNISLIEFIKNYQPGFEYILHTIRWFLPALITNLTILQFSIMILSLKLRCSKLNNALSTMLNFAKQQNLNFVRNIEMEYQNLRTRSIQCCDNIADTIWNLSVVYDVICDICKTINKVFAFQITFGLFVKCILLTFIMYGIATYITNTTQPFKWAHLATNSQTLLLHLGTIFGMIYSCNGVMNDVDKVATLLHKLKPKRVQHRDAINTFSLHLMHQKVQFTAGGLFNLDYTFIYLLISTITTYMVILVQFGTKTAGS